MSQNKPIIFYDGLCNLCSASVQFILKHEDGDYFLFSPLQGETAKSFLPIKEREQLQSIFLYNPTNKEILAKSKAAFAIASYFKWPWKLLSLLRIFPVFFTDRLYELIAKNRYRLFGKKKFCETPNRQISHRFLP